MPNACKDRHEESRRVSSEQLERKCAERDVLSEWLAALDREGAGPEAKFVVQAQLDRVVEEIARLLGHKD